jgi:glycosyltransferase involved in cell wall biosynthesis
MTLPLVSIVIPAYKAGRYIRETLESIRAQTHTHWEILACEDGVFDDTADQLAAFAASSAKPVRVFRHEKNLGVSRTRNRLLDEVRGDYIAFLDADDLWTPDHLEHSIATMDREDTSWIVGGLDLIDSQGVTTQRNILPPAHTMEALPTELLRYNFILPSGMVARAEIFKNGPRFDPSLAIGEDLDLCIELARAGRRVSYSTKVTLRYRKHQASATGDPARMAEGLAQLFTKHLHNPVVDRSLCRQFLIGNLVATARLTRKTQPARSRKAARQLIRLRPWHPLGWLFLVAR